MSSSNLGSGLHVSTNQGFPKDMVHCTCKSSIIFNFTDHRNGILRNEIKAKCRLQALQNMVLSKSVALNDTAIRFQSCLTLVLGYCVSFPSNLLSGISVTSPGNLRRFISVRIFVPVLSESTTWWKSLKVLKVTHGKLHLQCIMELNDILHYIPNLRKRSLLSISYFVELIKSIIYFNARYLNIQQLNTVRRITYFQL